jgi:pyruvate/2-oxoacid:ferredoxin oxidoreductase alpha subunit
MHGALEAVEPARGEASHIRPLTGNEAIARGAWEAGVKVAAAYPGTPSTEILETLAGYPAEDVHAQWSTNEKVALDVAIGASFAGRRAFAAMKHVGLNVAADAFMSQTYIGVNGGLVLAICDDPGIHSSQNEQDTRIYGALASVPVLEPSDAQEALEFTRLAFELSETFDTPVIVRSTTRFSHTRSAVAIGDRKEPPPRGFIEKPSKNVMIPAYARPRHGAVIEREGRLKAHFAEAPINRWEAGDTSFGIITAGTCYPYVREVLPDANVLKLGASWPLPDALLRRYCESVAGGKRVAQSQTYEPTSRGGFCNADLVISDVDVDFPLTTAIDQLVLLDRLAIKPSWPQLKPGALVIADSRLCPELPAGDYRRFHLPLSRTALELGSERVTNIVALGALVALSGICDFKRIEQAVRAETPRGFLDLNIDALKADYSMQAQADDGDGERQKARAARKVVRSDGGLRHAR